MKFIVTRELGRLAKWLRILGFDTTYFKQDNSGSLMVEALRDERVILTRNHRLAKHVGLKIMLVEAEKLKEQIAEVLKNLPLKTEANQMFRRCILCNKELMPIKKEKVKDRVPEYVFSTQEDFVHCPQCKRIYWQGTHWGNVQSVLKKIGSL